MINMSMHKQDGLTGLTGSGTLHPPTQAHSWFPNRDGYMDVALAGTLQNSSHTTWGMNVVSLVSKEEPAG